MNMRMIGFFLPFLLVPVALVSFQNCGHEGISSAGDVVATPTPWDGDEADDLEDEPERHPAEVVKTAAPAGPSRPLDEFEKLIQDGYNPPKDLQFYVSQKTAPIVAHHCLAAAGVLRRAHEGAAFSPSFVAEMKDTVKTTATALVRMRERWKYGWGEEPGANQLKQRKLPKETAFSWDTALPVWCLAEAGTLLEDETFHKNAREVAYAWIRHKNGYYATTKLCETCGYFWYALSSKLKGLYIKNTNILMGAAFIALGRELGDATILDAGKRATRSHYVELRKLNLYYKGVLEKDYTDKGSDWLNDHNYIESWAMLHAGTMAGSMPWTCAGGQQFEIWAKMGRSSFRGARRDEHERRIDLASCHFARRLAFAKKECLSAIRERGKNIPATYVNGLVLDYRPQVPAYSEYCKSFALIPRRGDAKWPELESDGVD